VCENEGIIPVPVDSTTDSSVTSKLWMMTGHKYNNIMNQTYTMDETKPVDYTRFANLSNTEAAFHNIRQRLQRCPSNLLQCTDQNGNIDAFRYIEFSKRRRVDFFKRANFICTMKSTLQEQQRQQLQRSASLPRVTGMLHGARAMPLAIPSSLARLTADIAAAPTTTNAFRNTPAPSSLSAVDSGNRGVVCWETVEGFTARRNSCINNDSRAKIAPNVSARFMQTRSFSMPLASSLAMKKVKSSSVRPDSNSSSNIATQRGSNDEKSNKKDLKTSISKTKVVSSPLPTPASTPSSSLQSEEKQQQGPSPTHRHLEKEEIEAAEALLFGIGRHRRRSEAQSSSLPTVMGDKGCPSEMEGGTQVGRNLQPPQSSKTIRPHVTKKRKIADYHLSSVMTSICAAGDDVESSTIVSTEDEISENWRQKHFKGGITTMMAD